jgi:hypothetical protein
MTPCLRGRRIGWASCSRRSSRRAATYTFSYCHAYCFTLRSTHRFRVAAGHEASLDLVVEEAGGVTTPIEERPTLRWAWSER